MASSLVPCGSCGRHIRGGEPRCPFCRRGPLRSRTAQIALVAASSLLSSSARADEVGDAGVDAASDAGVEQALEHRDVPIYGAPSSPMPPGCHCDLAEVAHTGTSPLLGVGLVALSLLRRRKPTR